MYWITKWEGDTIRVLTKYKVRLLSRLSNQKKLVWIEKGERVGALCTLGLWPLANVLKRHGHRRRVAMTEVEGKWMPGSTLTFCEVWRASPDDAPNNIFARRILRSRKTLRKESRTSGWATWSELNSWMSSTTVWDAIRSCWRKSRRELETFPKRGAEKLKVFQKDFKVSCTSKDWKETLIKVVIRE